MDDLWEKGEVFRLLKGSPGTQYQEATDTERKIIRDWIRLLLQKTAARIDFVKSDGTVRQMRCTLDHDQIPVSTAKPIPVPAATTYPTPVNVAEAIAESAKPRKQPSDETLRVYDLDKQEWRSFRFDRLQNITVDVNFAAK
jgi:hypothetical protein